MFQSLNLFSHWQNLVYLCTQEVQSSGFYSYFSDQKVWSLNFEFLKSVKPWGLSSCPRSSHWAFLSPLPISVLAHLVLAKPCSVNHRISFEKFLDSAYFFTIHFWAEVQVLSSAALPVKEKTCSHFSKFPSQAVSFDFSISGFPVGLQVSF